MAAYEEVGLEVIDIFTYVNTEEYLNHFEDTIIFDEVKNNGITMFK